MSATRARAGRGADTGHPVTAFSAVNGLGGDTSAVLASLHAGRAGLSAAPAGTPFATVCGTVRSDLPALPPELAAFDGRVHRIVNHALAGLAGAVADAVSRWGAARVGLAIGSSTCAMAETEVAFARHVAEGALPPGFDVQRHASPEALLHVLRARSGIAGPGVVVATACSSSAKVFATARRWLGTGVVDAVLVGGADSLCQTTLRGFRALSLVAPDAARPFSAERWGINVGEGAALALLERSGRGPRLLGVGESADAHHMSSPDPSGHGARLAMERALADAGVAADEVDHVNAHGTGTRLNDAMEAEALRAVLGAGTRALTVSTKGYTGHMLGAAGATEAVFVLDALATGRVPASLGAEPVDPALPLEVCTAPVRGELRVALSNSFAFGGSNVSLVFGAPA